MFKDISRVGIWIVRICIYSGLTEQGDCKAWSLQNQYSVYSPLSHGGPYCPGRPIELCFTTPSLAVTTASVIGKTNTHSLRATNARFSKDYKSTICEPGASKAQIAHKTHLPTLGVKTHLAQKFSPPLNEHKVLKKKTL